MALIIGEMFFEICNPTSLAWISSIKFGVLSTLGIDSSLHFYQKLIYSTNFRFGVVERIKILHNKRSAALVQMQTPDMAEYAVNEQHVLNR